MEPVISFLSLTLSSIHMKSDFMSFQWGIGLAFCSIPIAFYFSKKLGLWMGILVAYTSISSQSLIMNLWNKYTQYPAQARNDLSINSGFTFMLCLVVLFAMTEMPDNFVRGIRKAIPFYTVLNAAYVVLVHFMGWKFGESNGDQGFLDYSGMNGILIASCMGFFIWKWDDSVKETWFKFIGFILCVYAIYLSHSAMAWGVLGVTLVGAFKILWLMPLCLGAGFLSIGQKMMNSSMRFPAYKLFMKELWSRGMFIFGTGLGTYKVYAPMVQLKSHFMIDPQKGGWLWMWLHSDGIFQLVFECGIVGLILFWIVYFRAFQRLWIKQDDALLSLLLGLGASSIFDYPTRYFPTAFLSAFVLVSALKKDPDKEYPTSLYSIW